jgi:hypothetical protein
MSELQERAQTATAQREQLQQRIDELTMERQWVITQARKGKITPGDVLSLLGLGSDNTSGMLTTAQ